jgi:hypothetical protein
MSEKVLDKISDMCNVSTQTGVVLSDWCKEIVYLIPKESGVDELEKQRPLKLQEALKKITIGIRKNRMARLWHKLGVVMEATAVDRQIYDFGNKFIAAKHGRKHTGSRRKGSAQKAGWVRWRAIVPTKAVDSDEEEEEE